jgi:hypothetical protein
MSQAIKRILGKAIPSDIHLTSTLIRKIFVTFVLDDEWEGGEGGSDRLPQIAAMMGNTVGTWMSNYDCNGPHRIASDMNARIHPPLPVSAPPAPPAPLSLALSHSLVPQGMALSASSSGGIVRARRASSTSHPQSALGCIPIDMDAANKMGTKALQAQFLSIFGQTTTSGNQKYLRRAVTGSLATKKRAGPALEQRAVKRQTAADISTWLPSFCSLQ